MKHRAKLAAALLAAAVLSLAATACSSSGSGSTAASGTQKAAGAALPNKGTITVGTVCSCSGVEASSYQAAQATYEAWQSWTNAHGGINGYAVKLIFMNDGLNPTTSVSEVKTLIQQDHAVAIIGENSLVDAEWASYAEQQGVPVIGGGTTDSPMNSNPDFFPSGTGTANLQTASFVVMKQLNLNHYGVLYCAEAQTCATLITLSKLGTSIVDKSISVAAAKISTTQPNYDAACLAMKSKGVDALQVGESGPTVIRVIDQCSQLGYKPTIDSATTTFNMAMLQDSNFNGSYWVSPDANYTDTSVPGVKIYHDALQQYAPQVLTSPSFDINDMWGWIGGQLFAKAAENAHLTPSSTPADLKAGLYEIKNETLDGLTPPLTFTKGQPTNPAGFLVMQVKNGKLVGNTAESLTTAQVQALDKGLASS